MEQFFSQLARQSLAAGWMILALLILRPVLKKAPRSFSCLLWGLTAVRLAVPFSLNSPVSLVPQAIAAPTRIAPVTAAPLTAAPAVTAPAVTAPAVQTAAPALTQSVSWQDALPYVWLIGAAAMGIYALVSYIRLVNRVQVSIRVRDNLYLCDNVRSPFVLGVFRPRIYLPSDMDQAMSGHVLAHERAHLRRGDHIWKPLGFCLLCLHWFNPLCWIGFVLFCRDMEQACDERVIKNMTPEDKKAYSAALLRCSLPRSAIAACPLAFGEISVKQRIRGILNYRKPAVWVVAVSAVLCVALACCFLTDPVEAGSVDDPQVTAPGTVDDMQMNGPNPAEGQTIVLPQKATLRIAPSEGGRIVAELPAGEVCTVLRQETVANQPWAFLRSQDGKVGWVRVADGEPVPSASDPAESQTILLSQDTPVYSAPTEKARVETQLRQGEECALLRREFVQGESWGCIQLQEGSGWIHFAQEDEVLACFWGYVAAMTQETPEAAEEYLYLASDYDREFFRDMYGPVTGWAPGGIFQVNDNLWGILFTGPGDNQTDYAFVGRMENRLYVFQNARQVPAELSENLDAASYEKENVMYPSEEYKEGYVIAKRLMAFAHPVQIVFQEDGTRNYAGGEEADPGAEGWRPVPIAYEDFVCGTDTWREAEPTNGKAHCAITLYAADGSTARIWDADGSVLVTRPDGSRECYAAAFTGEETITMIYDWAKAYTPEG